MLSISLQKRLSQAPIDFLALPTADSVPYYSENLDLVGAPAPQPSSWQASEIQSRRVGWLEHMIASGEHTVNYVKNWMDALVEAPREAATAAADL